MGMDVYGKSPTLEYGKYFRASVWSWHPIWNYCATLAPKLCAKVVHGHTNDGDGLDAEDARALGAVVIAAIEDGRAKRYLVDRATELAALPLEACPHCKGTGTRNDAYVCNGCNGRGKRESLETHYTFSLDHLEEFGRFLMTCGGFEIH